MVERIKAWLAEGWEVRIFTARHGQDELIQDWLESIDLPRLAVTSSKDPMMAQLWDDRAVGVVTNVGTVSYDSAIRPVRMGTAKS